MKIINPAGSGFVPHDYFPSFFYLYNYDLKKNTKDEKQAFIARLTFNFCLFPALLTFRLTFIFSSFFC
jgi:hypothetical protein